MGNNLATKFYTPIVNRLTQEYIMCEKYGCNAAQHKFIAFKNANTNNYQAAQFTMQLITKPK